MTAPTKPVKRLKKTPVPPKSNLRKILDYLPVFQPKPKKWSKYIPYLELYIHIPLFSVQTTLTHSNALRQTFEVIKIEIELYKWSWYFNLYRKAL